MATGNPQLLPASEGGTGVRSLADLRDQIGIGGLYAADGGPTQGIELQLANVSMAINPIDVPDTQGYAAAIGFVITRTITGDAVGIEGLFCINTFDNNLKCYCDAGWRTIASW